MLRVVTLTLKRSTLGACEQQIKNNSRCLLALPCARHCFQYFKCIYIHDKPARKIPIVYEKELGKIEAR